MAVFVVTVDDAGDVTSVEIAKQQSKFRQAKEKYDFAKLLYDLKKAGGTALKAQGLDFIALDYQIRNSPRLTEDQKTQFLTLTANRFIGDSIDYTSGGVVSKTLAGDDVSKNVRPKLFKFIDP